MRTKKHPVEKRIAPVQFFRKAALCKALTRNREKFLQLFAGVFLLNISGDERLFLTNRRPRQRARRRRFAGLPGTSQANEKTNCPFFRSSAHQLTCSSSLSAIYPAFSGEAAAGAVLAPARFDRRAGDEGEADLASVPAASLGSPGFASSSPSNAGSSGFVCLG